MLTKTWTGRIRVNIVQPGDITASVLWGEVKYSDWLENKKGECLPVNRVETVRKQVRLTLPVNPPDFWQNVAEGDELNVLPMDE